jgi:uncharacterized protein with GYD domain
MVETPTETADVHEPGYIVLMKLTDKGALEPVPGEVLAQALGAIEALDGHIDSADVALGEWDYVVRCSGLNDEAMLQLVYYVARQGLLRTTTLVARPAAQAMSALGEPDPRLAKVESKRYHI